MRRRDGHPRIRALLRHERGRDRNDRREVLARRVDGRELSPRTLRQMRVARYGFLGARPTVNETDTLRPDISVNRSPGAGSVDFFDAPENAVMAWLLLRLLTAKRILDCESLDEPRIL